MAEQLFEEFGQACEILLVPGSGGVFEVAVDGEPVFSKLATGRHAEYEDVAPAVRSKVG